jgi:uncharacterized protein YecE (DUF72 family)
VHAVRIGCSGWNYADWRRRVYPKGCPPSRWLEHEPLVRTPMMGPVLWQLPGNFQRDDERLAKAIESLPPGRHTFEFRHPSWFTPDVYELLRERGVALTRWRSSTSTTTGAATRLATRGAC